MGLVVAAAQPGAQPVPLVRVSVSSTGTEGAGASRAGRISGDGRFVTFESQASDLVADDANRRTDVFVRDRLLGRTVRVSVSSSGAETPAGSPLNGSATPSIDERGRFVAFSSRETTFAPGDMDQDLDLFVHDRDADGDDIFDEPGQIETRRVSVRDDGSPGDCGNPCTSDDEPTPLGLSGNGRHVFFVSRRAFVADDADDAPDVYGRDWDTGVITRVGRGQLAPIAVPDPPADRTGRFVLGLDRRANEAGAGPAVFIDRDRNGNGRVDEAVDAFAELVPRPPGVSNSGVFPAALSAGGNLVAVTRVGPSPAGLTQAELWIWQRPTGQWRLASGVGATTLRDVPLSADERRVTFRETTEASRGGATVVVVLDGNGDGEFDSEAAIAASRVIVPDVPDEGGKHFDGTLRYAVLDSAVETLVPGDSNQARNVFVLDRDSPAHDTFDTDGDGLAQAFETRFGLDPASASGDDVGSGDPDGDARSNAQEQTAGTHPRGFFTRYLAEGATGTFFSTRIALANPGGSRARVLLRYQTDTGHTTGTSLTVGPLTRQAIDVAAVPTLANSAFSTVIESDAFLVSDRTMSWDAGAGAHAETSLPAAATTWYLAEGATHGAFDLFYEGATGRFFDLFVLLANPGLTAADVRLTYLRPTGSPIVRSRTLLPQSRTTINVAAEDPALSDTPVSTIVTATNAVPVVVERAMWWPGGGGGWQEAHNAFGARQAAARWAFADGETGTSPPHTQTYLLVANPTSQPAVVRVTLLLADGPPVGVSFSVAAHSRLTVPVGVAFPESAGLTYGALVESLGVSPAPIVVERAMYSDRRGVVWAAGTDVLGTPVP